MINFHEQLLLDAGAVEMFLQQIIAQQETPAMRLREAMHYAVLNGGKRMRTALVCGAYRMAISENAKNDPNMNDHQGAIRVAAAIECLHAYSLVHDDLPAMDDANIRRGKPSVHKMYDEATAILVGDALQTLAFEILADPATHNDAAIRIRLISALAQSSGLAGMAGGQMLDLEAEERPFDFAETKAMQMMKTGALIACAVISGGIAGGASDRLLAAQSAYAENLGLAFQIADDLLDYTSNADALGKPAGQDAAQGKAGFVALMGLQKAADEANNLITEANNALTLWPASSGYMQSLATFAITRKT